MRRSPYKVAYIFYVFNIIPKHVLQFHIFDPSCQRMVDHWDYCHTRLAAALLYSKDTLVRPMYGTTNKKHMLNFLKSIVGFKLSKTGSFYRCK